ncbi:MAG: YciI family protein [Acidobacteria bacterium]|nr:YciI family protein [Acidobacteriota bacterium]
MRVLVLIKANSDSENGVMPSEQLLTEMGAYNDELVKAGILLAGEGLYPSSKAARVLFAGEKRTVVDGPFAETKELIAGFWLWQVKSLDEAIEWVKRCPNPDGGESQIEIRPIFEMADFAEQLTPELRAEVARGELTRLREEQAKEREGK